MGRRGLFSLIVELFFSFSRGDLLLINYVEERGAFFTLQGVGAFLRLAPPCGRPCVMTCVNTVIWSVGQFTFECYNNIIICSDLHIFYWPI